MNSKQKPQEMIRRFDLYRRRSEQIIQNRKRKERKRKDREKARDRELLALYKEITSDEKGWYWQVLCQSDHVRYYEALNNNRNKEIIRSVYKTEQSKKEIPESLLKLMKALHLPVFPDSTEAIPDMNLLPPHSFFLRCQFELEKPYISKDETDFYIIDNPVKKEHVFKVPFIAASSWKGNLRWVMSKILIDRWESLEEGVKKEEMQIIKFAQTRLQLTSLFGNENKAYSEYFDKFAQETKEDYQKRLETKANKDNLLSGRFYFYPTFFNRIGLEVINPHNRKKKAGTVPILIESVPEGTTGIFSLLYVPFDLIGSSENDVKKEVAQDLELLRGALKSLMQIYGFSAKRTSGYGVVKEDIIPKIRMTDWQKQLLNIRENTEQESSKEFHSFEGLETMITRVITTLRA